MSKNLAAMLYGLALLIGSAAAARAASPVIPGAAAVPEPGVSAMLAGCSVAAALFIVRNRTRR